MKDDDQKITDEELQRLIDINEADSSEPGSISPNRRKKLLKDTENRIASLADFFKPGDIIIDYFEERRAALLRGDSAKEIDTLTEDYAEQNGIDLDVFDEDWIGTERLKLKQISRIVDEVEKDAALEALAVESILKEDQQKALRPAREFTEEWFDEQSRGHRMHQFKYFIEHLIYSLKHPLNWIGDMLGIGGLIAGWILIVAFDYRWFAVIIGLFVISGSIYVNVRFCKLYEKKKKETWDRRMRGSRSGRKDAHD